jgi:hypothetical protein
LIQDATPAVRIDGRPTREALEVRGPSAARIESSSSLGIGLAGARAAKWVLDFDACVCRLEDHICRNVASYDRRMCKRAIGRCCKARQMTLQNATRCVERSLPKRPRWIDQPAGLAPGKRGGP